MTGTVTTELITYVIPCGADKATEPAPAREMYRGQMFRHTLASTEAMIANNGENARILILSARYGLLELDTVIEPYEQRMNQPGAITAEQLTAQALALGIDWGVEVYAFLPRPYLARLDAALRALDVYVQDVYEAAPGIGYQRHTNANVATFAPAPEDTMTPQPTAPAAVPAPRYTATCPWCEETRPYDRKPPNQGVIGCDKAECIAAHNEAVREYQRTQREQAAQRRRERRANPPQPVYGEWGMAVLIGRTTRTPNP